MSSHSSYNNNRNKYIHKGMASQLSQRGRLPSWNRPGLCRRSGTDVRKLSRDQLSPVFSTSADGGTESGGEGDYHATRVVQLEKNILFLKQQHNETLEQLHSEIERFKKENRELNFKLVMCQCGNSKKGANMKTMAANTPPNDDLRIILLENEIRGLRNGLENERSKNNRLMRVIEKKILEKQKSSGIDQSDSDNSGIEMRSQYHTIPRLPTLEESMIVQQLQKKSNQQAHELLQIKADLRDVLYSHKWTPDAFLMARAYVTDGVKDSRTLPQVQPQHSDQLEKAYQRVKEEVTLPALKPKVPSMVAQRYRRAQAIRARAPRSLL